MVVEACFLAKGPIRIEIEIDDKEEVAEARMDQLIASTREYIGASSVEVGCTCCFRIAC